MGELAAEEEVRPGSSCIRDLLFYVIKFHWIFTWPCTIAARFNVASSKSTALNTKLPKYQIWE